MKMTIARPIFACPLVFPSEFESEYDGAARPTVMTADSGKTRTNFYLFSGVLDKIEYDDGVNVTTDNFSYDNFLRPTSSVSKDSVTRTLTYTDRGSLKTDTTGYSNQNYVTEYEYDSRGRNTKIKYPSGRAVSYTFTDRSELDLVTWDSVNIEDRGYDALGRLDSIFRPNSVNETRHYDGFSNRLEYIDNGSSVGKVSYTYDENDNKLTETWEGTLAPYSFVTTPGSPTWPERFTTGYDAEDRLRNFIQPTISTDMELVRNQIGVITDPKTSDTDNARTFSSTWELTSLTPAGPIQVYDDDGQITTRHTGDILSWDAGGRMTVTRNQQWSISALLDGTSVVELYSYDVFGKRSIWEADGCTQVSTSNYNNPYGYTSRRHDNETGLMYFRARFYDNQTGEFISRDPLEYVDGMSMYRGYMIPSLTDETGLSSVGAKEAACRLYLWGLVKGGEWTGKPCAAALLSIFLGGNAGRGPGAPMNCPTACTTALASFPHWNREMNRHLKLRSTCGFHGFASRLTGCNKFDKKQFPDLGFAFQNFCYESTSGGCKWWCGRGCRDCCSCGAICIGSLLVTDNYDFCSSIGNKTPTWWEISTNAPGLPSKCGCLLQKSAKARGLPITFPVRCNVPFVTGHIYRTCSLSSEPGLPVA